MSFEFATRLEQLTKKLNQPNPVTAKQNHLQELQAQLQTLQSLCHKELDKTDRKLKKLEHKIKNRFKSNTQYSQMSEQQAIEKEDIVMQRIGEWVNDYEVKAERAVEELNKQQLICRTKMEEEQEKYSKEVQMMEDRLKNQVKTIEKELTKWKTINSQNHNSILIELQSHKQHLLRDVTNSKRIRQKEFYTVQRRYGTLKNILKEKIDLLGEDINKKNLKTKHIFELLLQID